MCGNMGKPEGIMLSKVSQTENDKYCYDFVYMLNLKKTNL